MRGFLSSKPMQDTLIVNGRKTGDIFGKYTSLQWNGCRVVDYLLASSPYFDKITKFQVGDFYPWLSDHFPLHYSISLIKHIDCYPTISHYTTPSHS